MSLEHLYLDLIDASAFDIKETTIEGTVFALIGRKADGVGLARIEKAVYQYWPEYVKRLGALVPNAVVMDFESAIGGGPFRRYVVGVYSSNPIPAEQNQLIEETLGWAPRRTTVEYIRDYYCDFNDPVQAYVDEMVVHELGHLYFGWGVTHLPKFDHEDLWVNLGMGMVYDREIWRIFNNRPSPLLQGVVDRWKDVFSHIKEVDQRLIGPNTSNDGRYHVQRKQIFDHGKAYSFLQAMREQVGQELFDSNVRQMLKDFEGQPLLYRKFSSYFTGQSLAKIQSLEQEMGIV